MFSFLNSINCSELRSVTSIPFTVTLPFVGVSNPPMMFNKVVLPEPEGPTTAVNSPL